MGSSSGPASGQNTNTMTQETQNFGFIRASQSNLSNEAIQAKNQVNETGSNHHNNIIVNHVHIHTQNGANDLLSQQLGGNFNLVRQTAPHLYGSPNLSQDNLT